METQIGVVAVTEPARPMQINHHVATVRRDRLAADATDTRATLPKPIGRKWIISPAVDLLFFCNLPWLLAFLPLFLDADALPRAEFWQIYFLTTPHRWLTLLLVATDSDRRGDRTKLFALLAVVFGLAVIAVRISTGVFACLALADYLWNAWHFGSQHAGILRLYRRRAGNCIRSGLETWGVRILVVYTSIRLAGWLTGWTEIRPLASSALGVLDHAMLLIPLLLIAASILRFQSVRIGGLAYLTSVCLLYFSLLWSVSHGISSAVVSLSVAASAFHAVEYLALVSFYADQRRSQGAAGLFRELAKRWGMLLAVYIVAIGLMGYFLAKGWFAWWLGLNLWAAFLHYAYDGMIWKLRLPATAAVLGAKAV